MSCADGYNKLWGWFGLSRASWITIPRVLAHEMPDEWQGKMADLLAQYSEATRNAPASVSELTPIVNARSGNHNVKWPDWILQYRHPQAEHLGWMRERLCKLDAHTAQGEHPADRVEEMENG